VVLAWSTIEVPFSSGLDTKGDARAGRPPKLDIARDVQFDELGGLQTRKPFPAMSNQIFGGGTLANCRRLAVVNGELCVFTDTALYSWNAQLAKWVLRATHLAAAIEETPVFATTGDQIDGDRAELNGTVVVVWNETAGIFGAAYDKATGAVLVGPTAFSGIRPRLVALATKILLFTFEVTDLRVRAIDPANPAPGIAGVGTQVFTNFNAYYDVVKIDGQDQCAGVGRLSPTTSYAAFKVTAALVITTSVKGRTADGPVAVSVVPGGAQIQIVRSNGPNVQGDLLTTSTLADVFVNQALGMSGTDQIAACHRSAQNGGAFRCYVFATAGQSPTGLSWGTSVNWVDSAGVIGTPITVALQVVAASRAFDCNGSVFAWLAFGSTTSFANTLGGEVGSTLQNSYFLYRDDAFLCAKAVTGTGGGFPPSTGRLPGITALSSTSFAWCASRKRRFVAGATGNEGFAARSLIDVQVDLDSDEARRTAVIGRTMYLAAGEVLQYDGVGLVECGFHVFPWFVGMIEVPGGSLTAGSVYAYKSTWRYQNGQNETERSSTATIGTITLTVGTRVDLLTPVSLTVTHKLSIAPGVEYWRTTRNPAGPDEPFRLVTSNDPAATVNPNRYLANAPAAGFGATIQDVIGDTALLALEANPENGAVLPSFSPPPARIVIATDTRLFLAGVAGDPDAVWYSRRRGEGEIAAFNETLRVAVPRTGGAVTALAFNNETLTVFRETAIYALPGDGLDNLGFGSNFGPARTISLDVGAVNHESVALTPMGLVFKSSKGWYLLTPSWTPQYIGAQVNAYDAEDVLAVHVVESQHHVRILTGSRMIVWDYSAVTAESPLGQWGEWTVSTPVHAAIWNGQHVLLTPTGPVAQALDYTGTNYGIDVETAWVKPVEQQGEFFLRWMAALGEYRSSHLVRMRLARDYQYDGAGNPAYFDDFTWSPSPTTAGSALQVKHPPTQNRMQAFKARLTAVTDAVRATMVTTSLAPQIATSGTVWNSTWRAAEVGDGLVAYGEMGNRLSMSVAFVPFVPETADELPVSLPYTFESETALVLVNDHFTWSVDRGRWVEDLDNIGVLVSGTITVAELEGAIATGTSMVTLLTPDAAPSKVVNVAAMLAGGLVSAAAFTGGAFGSPTGESIKLTGLALEIGLERGINRRLPPEQKL
jgi:hypothetical protein